MRPLRAMPVKNPARKHGFALLTTMLLLALLITGLTELVTLTSTNVIVVNRRGRNLGHELAVDSAILLIADGLSESPDRPSRIIRDLDRLGVAIAAFEIGGTNVSYTLRDDGAKFNPLVVQESYEKSKLTRKLKLLGAKLALPRAAIDLRPVILRTKSKDSQQLYRWFDQLLVDAPPESLMRWDESSPASGAFGVWSDAVTFWGDGRVDVRRVDRDVLNIVLEDLRPGLARVILRDRSVDASQDFLGTALTRVDAEIRPRVAARLTFDAKRYGIRIDTSIGADRRRWYVVAEIDDDSINVLHRSRVTW